MQEDSDSCTTFDVIEPFLQNAKKGLLHLGEFESVTVVMGNETCDLDSVACSMAYGVYFYDHYLRNSIDCLSIALLDCLPDDVLCKTEVLYWMKKLKVQVSNFIFRGQIDLFELYSQRKLRLVLVDHHVLANRYKGLEPAVIEIVDHRPLQKGVAWPCVEFKVRIAGSCASLMAKKLLKMRRQLFTVQMAMLLYGPIVLDTAALSRSSGRTTEIDVTMADMFETMYEECNRDRTLRELVEARADISSLNTSLLLKKDLKIAGGVPIVGIPVSMRKIMERDDLEASLLNFCEHSRAKIVLIMGQEVIEKNFLRTLGVFALEGAKAAANKLIQFLQAANDPELFLSIMSEESEKIPGLSVFSQLNDQASRKQMMPLVLEALNTLPELERMREPCSC